MKVLKLIAALCYFFALPSSASPLAEEVFAALRSERSEIARGNLGRDFAEEGNSMLLNVEKNKLTSSKDILHSLTSESTTAALYKGLQVRVAVKTVNPDGSIEKLSFAEHSPTTIAGRLLVQPEKFKIPGRIGIQYTYDHAKIPHSVVESFIPQTFKGQTLRVQSGMYLEAKNFQARIVTEGANLQMEFTLNGVTRYAATSAIRSRGNVIAYEIDETGSHMVFYSTSDGKEFFREIVPLDINARPPHVAVTIPQGEISPLLNPIEIQQLAAAAEVRTIPIRTVVRDQRAVGNLNIHDSDAR